MNQSSLQQHEGRSRRRSRGWPRRSRTQRLRLEKVTLQREVARLKELAFRDPLTKLRNRRCLDQRLNEELSRARRYPQEGFSVLIIDLNEFKQVNDRYGHDVGDETLKQVAGLLQDILREHDVCFRIGGDEFAALLPHTNARACAQVVQRLRAEIEVMSGRVRHFFGLSIGSASWSTGSAGVGALLRTADAAMYADKRRQKTMTRSSGSDRGGRVGSQTAVLRIDREALFAE